MSKSCLIIGDGSSKSLISPIIKYNVDAIIGIHYIYHPDTSIICSIDIRDFRNKEYMAIQNNLPLIIGVSKNTNIYKRFPGIQFHNLTNFIQTDMVQDSGLFAIWWAYKNNYKYIYTAGIDFNHKNHKYKPGLINELNIEINKINHALFLENKKYGIYKICKNNNLIVPCFDCSEIYQNNQS